jgi:glutaminase
LKPSGEHRDIDEGTVYPFLSTGRLPSPELVQALVAEAHELHRANAEGANSRVYPALVKVPPLEKSSPR